MKEESQEQTNYRPWLFKKGQSGNPGGRPKGSVSLKTYAKEMLAKMNEEERQNYLAGLDKEIIWKMAEGNPSSDDKLDTTVKIIIAQEDDSDTSTNEDTTG